MFHSLRSAAASAAAVVALAAAGAVSFAAPAAASHVAGMTVTQAGNQGAYVTLQVDLTYTGASGGSIFNWSTGDGRDGSVSDGVSGGVYAGDASGSGSLSGGAGALGTFTWSRTQPAPNVARTRITYAYSRSGVYQVSWDECCPTVSGTTAVSVAGSMPACSDAADNDGDGAVDYPGDPGCSSAGDESEFAECPEIAGVAFCLEPGDEEITRATVYNVDPSLVPLDVQIGRIDLYDFRTGVVSVRLPCVVLDSFATNACALAGGTYASTVATLAAEAVIPRVEIGDPVTSVGICEAELVFTVLDVGITSAPALAVCETGTVSF